MGLNPIEECGILTRMEAHTWRENTSDGKMIYRASHHGTKWKLERTQKVSRSEEGVWEPLEFTREDWLTLRDLLWRKYQRKRCPWRLIEEIDKTLEDEFPESAEEDTREDWEKWIEEDNL